MNAKGFLNRIKQGVSNVTKTGNLGPIPLKEVPGVKIPGFIASKYQEIKGRNAQNKMVENYVRKQPSKIPSEDRKMDSAINENEQMDKALRAKMKAKNKNLF